MSFNCPHSATPGSCSQSVIQAPSHPRFLQCSSVAAFSRDQMQEAMTEEITAETAASQYAVLLAPPDTVQVGQVTSLCESSSVNYMNCSVWFKSIFWVLIWVNDGECTLVLVIVKYGWMYLFTSFIVCIYCKSITDGLCLSAGMLKVCRRCPPAFYSPLFQCKVHDPRPRRKGYSQGSGQGITTYTCASKMWPTFAFLQVRFTSYEHANMNWYDKERQVATFSSTSG